MPAPPRVSILLPCRDATDTLATCLRSIERQSIAHWECVLVDDGSRDDTRALAGAFADRDDRIRVLAPPRRGLVPALNTGLQACRAPLVARMDADDVMHRRRLELQLGALDAEPELAAVGCRVRLFPSASVGPGMAEYECWLNGIATPEDVRREAFVECPLAHPALMLRRDAVPDDGYRQMGWPEDYDLILRLLGRGRDIAVVPRRLLAWRREGNQLSTTHPDYAIEKFVACKAAFLASGFLRQVQRYVLWGYGRTGRMLRAALASHDKTPSHVVELHPGRLGNAIFGAPVIPPDELARIPRAPLVVSVAGAGPRAEIRGACAALGLVELRDFVCAA